MYCTPLIVNLFNKCYRKCLKVNYFRRTSFEMNEKLKTYLFFLNCCDMKISVINFAQMNAVVTVNVDAK